MILNMVELLRTICLNLNVILFLEILTFLKLKIPIAEYLMTCKIILEKREQELKVRL